MNERLRSALSVIVKIVLYIAFVAITIIGSRETSWLNLGIECIGLIGVVFMLFIYNRSQR